MNELITIRPFQPGDEQWLAAISQDTRTSSPTGSNDPGHNIDQGIAVGGRAWTIISDRETVGYALLVPVPALDGVFELDGGVVPPMRRRGFARRLLSHVLEEARSVHAYQISCSVSAMNSPAALFLKDAGFFVEHEEYRMVLDDPSDDPTLKLPESCQIQLYGTARAIRQFRDLYERCFSGLAWYQPYESDDEVSTELADPGDILFILENRQPIGFGWLRWTDNRRAEIEPIGLVKAFQGRGFGRILLQALINHAAKQGAQSIALGVWKDNLRAIHLYEQMGFRRVETKTFLAINVSP